LDLGINVPEPATKGNLLIALYRFLVAQLEKGLTTVLVIDEAHQMPSSLLEEIRLLTNFETNQEKLLQVLLVGQPELDERLDSFELRQLKQRITIRCQLEPLSEAETYCYIERRLKLAGANLQAHTIFPAATMSAIYRYSSGIPRVVNSICEQALIAAYAEQVTSVPVEIIHAVAAYFRLETKSNRAGSGNPSLPVESERNPDPTRPRNERSGDASAEESADSDTSSTGVEVPTTPPEPIILPDKLESSLISIGQRTPWA
jgi:hypothetical protein